MDANQKGRRRVAAANWKMNINTSEGKRLLGVLALANIKAGVELVICAPFTHLSSLQDIAGDHDHICVAAQNVSEYETGAYTGEVSVDMLLDLGVKTVVIGHSERRSLFDDTDARINQKIRLLVANGLTPILCCGEGSEVRQKGNHVTHVVAQLTAALDGIQAHQLEKLIIAYEPVWAIGTGVTATPAQAQEMHAAIRLFLARRFDGDLAQRVPILYGGSVKPNNAEEIFSKNDVDGGLVGGASLSAQDFVEIANSFE